MVSGSDQVIVTKASVVNFLREFFEAKPFVDPIPHMGVLGTDGLVRKGFRGRGGVVRGNYVIEGGARRGNTVLFRKEF